MSRHCVGGALIEIHLRLVGHFCKANEPEMVRRNLMEKLGELTVMTKLYTVALSAIRQFD